MFQGIHEHVVVVHGLVVTSVLLVDLIHEQLLLLEGVIQLSVGVAKLMVVNEKLKSLAQSWLGPVVFRKRRHFLGMLGDEGWVETLAFEKTAHQFINESGRGPRLIAVNFMLDAKLIEKGTSLFCM